MGVCGDWGGTNKNSPDEKSPQTWNSKQKLTYMKMPGVIAQAYMYDYLINIHIVIVMELLDPVTVSNN